MARLSAHLKYYVTKRITEDAEWRNVKVILSGHDVSVSTVEFTRGKLTYRYREKESTRFKNSFG
jgi:hypothetical protein